MSAEKSGPTVCLSKTTLRCGLCKYRKDELLRSGIDPQWQTRCTHPQADNHTGGYIGENHDETPDWCPELKRNKKGCAQ